MFATAQFDIERLDDARQALGDFLRRRPTSPMR
jgi:hypothetical protein